jgi:hypothetical protein
MQQLACALDQTLNLTGLIGFMHMHALRTCPCTCMLQMWPCRCDVPVASSACGPGRLMSAILQILVDQPG